MHSLFLRGVTVQTRALLTKRVMMPAVEPFKQPGPLFANSFFISELEPWSTDRYSAEELKGFFNAPSAGIDLSLPSVNSTTHCLYRLIMISARTGVGKIPS